MESAARSMRIEYGGAYADCTTKLTEMELGDPNSPR
jgi:hypothetical protein